jgi:hypothetical protein
MHQTDPSDTTSRIPDHFAYIRPNDSSGRPVSMETLGYQRIQHSQLVDTWTHRTAPGSRLTIQHTGRGQYQTIITIRSIYHPDFEILKAVTQYGHEFRAALREADNLLSSPGLLATYLALTIRHL